METAVRSTSMGLPSGTLRRKSTTAPGRSRAATSCFLQLVEFGLFGQPAVPKKKDDFFENGVVRQGVDVVSAIAQDALVAVDVTNFGFARDDAFEACCCRSHLLVISLRAENRPYNHITGLTGRRTAGERREPDCQVIPLHPELFLLVCSEIDRQNHTRTAGAALGDAIVGDVRMAALRSPILKK